jgi:hypothetical protein
MLAAAATLARARARHTRLAQLPEAALGVAHLVHVDGQEGDGGRVGLAELGRLERLDLGQRYVIAISLV